MFALVWICKYNFWRNVRWITQNVKDPFCVNVTFQTVTETPRIVTNWILIYYSVTNIWRQSSSSFPYYANKSSGNYWIRPNELSFSKNAKPTCKKSWNSWILYSCYEGSTKGEHPELVFSDESIHLAYQPATTALFDIGGLLDSKSTS